MRKSRHRRTQVSVSRVRFECTKYRSVYNPTKTCLLDLELITPVCVGGIILQGFGAHEVMIR